jgi:hypothetical protein
MADPIDDLFHGVDHDPGSEVAETQQDQEVAEIQPDQEAPQTQQDSEAETQLEYEPDHAEGHDEAPNVAVKRDVPPVEDNQDPLFDDLGEADPMDTTQPFTQEQEGMAQQSMPISQVEDIYDVTMEDSQEIHDPIEAPGSEHDDVMGEAQRQQQEYAFTIQSQEDSSLFIPEHDEVVGEVQGQQQQQASTVQPQEESSLFIPEQRISPPASTPTSPRAPPPPSRSSRPATPLPTSTFAKIRKMQEKLKQRKAAANKPHHSFQPMPDDEAYLEAAQSLRSEVENATIIDEYEKADKVASAEYQKQKRKYDQIRARQGKLGFREDIEWIRIQQAEMSRREKKKRDLQKAKEDDGEFDLFPEIHGPSHSREENESEDDVTDLDPSALLSGHRQPPMPHKAPKHISIVEAELQSMRVALDAAPDLPRKKNKVSESPRGQTSAASSAKSRSRPKSSKNKGNGTSSRASGSSANRARQATKNKKATAHAIRQATPMFSSNKLLKTPPRSRRSDLEISRMP